MNYKENIGIATFMLAMGIVMLLMIAFPQASTGLKIGVSAGISGGVMTSILAICQAIKGE